MDVPEFLIEKLNEQYGEDITKNIIEGYSKKRKVTFRVNTIKAEAEKIEEILRKEKIEFEKPRWSTEAFIIKNVAKKDIEKLPIYENGEIYLQSLSSMLPPIILNPKENTDILDMAAAPRWKNNTNGSTNFK